MAQRGFVSMAVPSLALDADGPIDVSEGPELLRQASTPEWLPRCAAFVRKGGQRVVTGQRNGRKYFTIKGCLQSATPGLAARRSYARSHGAVVNCARRSCRRSASMVVKASRRTFGAQLSGTRGVSSCRMQTSLPAVALTFRLCFISESSCPFQVLNM